MRCRYITTLAAASLVWLSSPNGLAGQEVAEHRLTAPSATYGDGFGSIRGLRELPDGRVLISDGLGQALIVADLAYSSADTVGRVGGGPDEYQAPDGLWPLPDDATLLVDLGNGRLTELGPDLSFGETMPMAQQAQGGQGPMMGGGLSIVIPRGVDGDGRVYFQGMGRMRGGAMPDSAVILRLDRESGAIDTVGRVKLEERKRTESGGGNNQNVMIRPRPLTAQDAWAAAWDGRVAVARAGDYHLDWITPDGQIVSGAPVEYEPLRVTRADKEEWVAGLRSGIGIAVTVDNDRMQTNFSRGGRGFGRDSGIDEYEWPERKPAFRPNVRVSRSGDAWVERHVEAGDPRMFDVFDARGNLKARVWLPDDRELIGFGEGNVYLMRRDEFDFEWLERYTLPTL